MIRLALGFAAGFVAAFVVMGRARQAALTADPYEDWRLRPVGQEWWWDNYTVTQETH